MKVSKIRINGIDNPIGFSFDTIRCSWLVSNTKAKKTEIVKIDVAQDKEFKNILFHKEGTNLNSSCEPLEVTIEPCTRYYVRVHATSDQNEEAEGVGFFETSKINQKWEAKWLKPRSEDQYHPIFEKDFEVKENIVSARLYISGLGLYTAKLNGKRIGDEVFTPYYSDYNTDVQYQTFDIKEYLQKTNQIHVELGNGWYKGYFGHEGKDKNWGSEFQILAEIRIRYSDKTEQIIGTDDTWTYYGSDTEGSDIYNGEIINRLLWEGKENPKKKPVEGQIKGKLIERYSLPVTEHDHMKVHEVIKTPAGETVLDFGQNFAGYIQFNNKYPKGTKIVIDYGEILQQGNFYNKNYKNAKAQIVYVSNGKEELVKPQFTYCGFRYARITGLGDKVDKNDFLGISLYSDMEITGHIETGNEKVNKLFSNVLWSQKSNFIDFPTDCPQRSERLGWTADCQVFCGTACYNMYTPSFYNKFIHDIRVEQKRFDGIMPGVIPNFDPKMLTYSAVWGDVATFLPTVLYECYGDKFALDKYYPMMKDWVDKIEKDDKERGKEHYMFDFGNQFGDWVALDGRSEISFKGSTDDFFISSCYYAMSAKMVADAAKILGKEADVKYYNDLYEKIRNAVLDEYFSPTGRLTIDTQTGYIVSLYSGIYRNKEKLIEGFRQRIYKDSYRIKGGFVGAPIMCKVMAENGLEDEAFYFLQNERFPSWIHCINIGATTVWERWNSVLDDGTISPTDMNSLNHYSFGSVIEFLYSDVAVLRPLEPAFKKALIKPLVNAQLGSCKCSYESANGLYRVEWNISKDGDVHFVIEVPIDCSAVVELPFYPKNEKIELDPGVHNFDYKPTKNLRAKYTMKSIFLDIKEDDQAMEVIKKNIPGLFFMLKGGGGDNVYENLETLKGMFYLGFSPEQYNNLVKEMLALTY